MKFLQVDTNKKTNQSYASRHDLLMFVWNQFLLAGWVDFDKNFINLNFLLGVKPILKVIQENDIEIIG